MFLLKIDQLKKSGLKNDSFCQVIGYDAIFTLKNVIVWFGNGCDKLICNFSSSMLKNYRLVEYLTCVQSLDYNLRKKHTMKCLVCIQFSIVIPPKFLVFLIEHVLQRWMDLVYARAHYYYVLFTTSFLWICSVPI